MSQATFKRNFSLNRTYEGRSTKKKCDNRQAGSSSSSDSWSRAVVMVNVTATTITTTTTTMKSEWKKQNNNSERDFKRRWEYAKCSMIKCPQKRQTALCSLCMQATPRRRHFIHTYARIHKHLQQTQTDENRIEMKTIPTSAYVLETHKHVSQSVQSESSWMSECAFDVCFHFVA